MTGERAVWKYEIPWGDDFTLAMPAGAAPFYVEEQYGQPCMWAVVDPSAPKSDRTFRLCGTGHPLRGYTRLTHIGTFLTAQGALVFHVFETTEESR